MDCSDWTRKYRYWRIRRAFFIYIVKGRIHSRDPSRCFRLTWVSRSYAFKIGLKIMIKWFMVMILRKKTKPFFGKHGLPKVVAQEPSYYAFGKFRNISGGSTNQVRFNRSEIKMRTLLTSFMSIRNRSCLTLFYYKSWYYGAIWEVSLSYLSLQWSN